MDNCDLKYKSESRSFATTNVTVSALHSIFGIDPSSACWLRDVPDTYIFPDESGAFPTLGSCCFYNVEVGATKRTEVSISSDESLDEFTAAYHKAIGTKNKRQRKSLNKGSKGKGPRAVPGAKAGTSGIDS